MKTKHHVPVPPVGKFATMSYWVMRSLKRTARNTRQRIAILPGSSQWNPEHVGEETDPKEWAAIMAKLDDDPNSAKAKDLPTIIEPDYRTVPISELPEVVRRVWVVGQDGSETKIQTAVEAWKKEQAALHPEGKIRTHMRQVRVLGQYVTLYIGVVKERPAPWVPKTPHPLTGK